MKSRSVPALLGLAAIVGAAFATSAQAEETMRLEWVMQGQFAGPIVAHEKGYYEEAGVDLTLLPAGPDIKPAVTVAQGSDSFGLGHPNQIIAARSNGVPLVMVMQFGQKSATTYVVRKEAGIASVGDMPGHSVGLWFGGDEHEFLAMLNAAGVSQDDVQIISQGFDIISWLNGEYEVMQVTRFNELLQVYDNGFSRDDLVLLDPEDYGVALISGGLFTTEKIIREKPDLVQGVVEATMRGWKDALADPGAAAEIVLKYNSELTLESQIAQIKAMGDLICAGPTLEGEFGKSVLADWETSQTVILEAGVVESAIDLEEGFTNQFWDMVSAENKQVACSM